MTIFFCIFEKLKQNKIKDKEVGARSTEFTLVDYPPMDDRSTMNLKSSDRLKQEVKYT